MQNELLEKVRYCGSNRCKYSQDPVLKALGGKGRPVPGSNIEIVMVESRLKHGEWTAVYERDSLRWLVIATGGDSRPMTFYAYERTGLVEGIAP